MGLFRRPGKGGKGETEPLTEVDAAITAKAQAVMMDHLMIMKEVVMKLRNEEGYAKSMYANCPRLQQLLDRNPDLRPVFEDPRLVRINFETVYKEAGGILPEDEEAEANKKNNRSWLVRIASHPIFRFLKVLLFVKKLIGCILGGGIAIIASCFGCCTDCCTDCCCEDALQVIEIDEYDDSDDEEEFDENVDTPLDENQRALHTAANYMEDPEVQEQMQRLLEDPDNLEDAIENDAELRALRDSNALCAELMQDPETMKILTDPDNLRALGEAPQMIQLDFADPHSFTPDADFLDIEAGNLDGFDCDASGDGTATFGGMDASGSMDGLEAYEADYDENDIQFEMEDDANDLFDTDDDESVGDDDESIGMDIGMGDMDGIGDSLDMDALDGMDEFDDEVGWGENLELELEEQLEMDAGAEPEVELELEDDGGDDNEGGWEDDVELEDQTETDADAAKKGKGKNAKAANKSKAMEEANKKGGMSGIIASFGVAATEVIASQIVGQVFGDGMGDFLTGGGGGGGDDMNLGGLDDGIADGVLDEANDILDDVDDVDAADDLMIIDELHQADDLLNEDVEDIAGIADDTVDDVEDQKKEAKNGGDATDGKNQQQGASRDGFDSDGRKAGIVGAGAAAGAAGAGASRRGKRTVTDDEQSYDDGLESCNSEEDYDEDEDDEAFENEGTSDNDSEEDSGKDTKLKRSKKNFFGAIKNIAAATATAAKEHVVGTLLGDDLAEMVVEKQEEMGEDSDSDSNSDSNSNSDDGKKPNKNKPTKSREFQNRGFLDEEEYEDSECETTERSSKKKKKGFFRRK